MTGFDHMALSLEAAALLCFLVVTVAALLFVRRVRALPTTTQAQREQALLVQTYSEEYWRKGQCVPDAVFDPDWRESFTGSIDEFNARDAA